MTERRLTLGSGVEAAIRTHGQQTYPHECCGALVGRGNHVSTAVALENTTEEGPRRRFLVRASDYREAERRAVELGGELLGFYHSHPDHPARPSQYDREHAWPWYSYIIVSVAKGKAQEMTSWRLSDDRSEYACEEITMRDSAAR